MTSDPKWLEHARLQLGIKEFKGAKHNPAILAFFAAVGHDEIDDDETAWCAAFMGAMLKMSGYPLPPRSINLMARSYLTYGKALAEPQIGCIGVFKRGTGWQGHVGIIVDWDDESFKVLGGNQGNSVSVIDIPRKQLLPNGLRWPVKADAKELKAAGSTEVAVADKLKTVAKTGVTVAVGVETIKETGLVDAAKDMTEGFAVGKGLLEGVQAVISLLASNALLVVAVAAIGLYFFARNMKDKRIARHANGAPIASELG